MNVSEVERFALIEIFNATDGHQWSNAEGWNTSADVCDWYGVTCQCEISGEGCDSGISYVVHLLLSDNQLSGAIPDAIAGLSQLEIINLEFNQLQGTLPESLGNMVSLEKLLLGYNQFSGSLPNELINLVNLEAINFHFNAFYTDNATLETFIDQRLTNDPANQGFYVFQAQDIENLSQVPNVSYFDLSNNAVGIELSGTNRGSGDVVILVSQEPQGLFQETEYRLEGNDRYIVGGLQADTRYYFKAVTRINDLQAQSDGSRSNVIEVVSPRDNNTASLTLNSDDGGSSSGGSLGLGISIILVAYVVSTSILGWIKKNQSNN